MCNDILFETLCMRNTITFNDGRLNESYTRTRYGEKYFHISGYSEFYLLPNING